MSFFKSLFGLEQNDEYYERKSVESMANSIAHLAKPIKLICSLESRWNNLQQRKVIVCYFYGFVDYLCSTSMALDSLRIPTACLAFRKVFDLSAQDAKDSVNLALESTKQPHYKMIMQEARNNIAEFIENGTGTLGCSQLSMHLIGAGLE